MVMLQIQTEREDDGRWLAEVPALPGVMSYGVTNTEARAKATALALRVIAERVENGEALPNELSGMFQIA
jgi:predicted RNase H-like HicB family nuclease